MAVSRPVHFRPRYYHQGRLAQPLSAYLRPAASATNLT